MLRNYYHVQPTHTCNHKKIDIAARTTVMYNVWDLTCKKTNRQDGLEGCTG
jgi:hypothetical protein